MSLDHLPLLFDTMGCFNSRSHHNHLFIFEAIWIHDQECEGIISVGWLSSASSVAALGVMEKIN